MHAMLVIGIIYARSYFVTDVTNSQCPMTCCGPIRMIASEETDSLEVSCPL